MAAYVGQRKTKSSAEVSEIGDIRIIVFIFSLL